MKCVRSSVQLLAGVLVALPVIAPAGAQGVTATPPLITATAHLTLSGGHHPGTYDAQMNTRYGCTYATAANGMLGLLFANSKARTDSTTFNNLQFSWRDAKAAASGTSEYGLTLLFGTLVPGQQPDMLRMITFQPPTLGRGTMTVTDADSTIAIVFSGVGFEMLHGGRDSVTYSGKVDCKAVRRVAQH